MGTSSLYFSALITSAKNFVGHPAFSLAIPIAAFGLSSFWEALLAGSPLFTKVIVSGGDVLKEVDVVKLFRFFAIMLGIVGVIGAFGLFVIPPHLPKTLDGEPTEEDALLPRAEESETSSIISIQSAKVEITAEHRPFLTEPSTYLFGLVLLVLLGTGEMFINCVRRSAIPLMKLGTMLQTLRTGGDFSPSLDPSRHISILALSSTLSRLISGLLSDYMSSPSRTHPISRVPLLLVFAIVQITALFLLVYAPLPWLRDWFSLGSALIGITYGGVFTLAPTLTSIVWGIGTFGRNWGILTFSPGISRVISSDDSSRCDYFWIVVCQGV